MHRLDDAAKLESKKLLKRVGEVAVTTLRGLHSAAGHQMVASSWIATPVVAVPDGFELVVKSNIEDKVIKHRSNNPWPRTRGNTNPDDWSLKGWELVWLLEYGAKPHVITPRKTTWQDGSGKEHTAFMTFPKADGAPNSDFVGTVINSSGVGGGFLDNTDILDTYYMTPGVMHPGHAGFHYLGATKILIEQEIQRQADLAARNIVLSVGG